MTLASADPALSSMLAREKSRQDTTLDMVASESIPDEITLELCGSAFNSKTVVGLPGHQRMAGSEIIDELEILASQRACSLFGFDHANILPYSGTVANLCVYKGLLKPGDTVLAFDPECGSHASHGRKGHISSELYNFIHYGVNPDTQLVDYDSAELLAEKYRPKLIIAGSSSYPRMFDNRRLKDIAHSIGAVYMYDMAHITGLVAANVTECPCADIVTASCTKTMCGIHTGFILCKEEFAGKIDAGVYPGFLASMHPQTIAAAAWCFERATKQEFRNLMRKIVINAKALGDALTDRGFNILTGGSDCHMQVIDLRGHNTNAVDAVNNLSAAGIYTNSKRLPYDNSPLPMGIRIGCTVPTQRGMGGVEMEEIANIIYRVIDGGEDCSEQVASLCDEFVIEI